MGVQIIKMPVRNAVVDVVRAIDAFAAEPNGGLQVLPPSRAVKEYIAGLDPEPNPDRKPPKVISLSDPGSAWTAKANKRVQFGYGLNYLIDVENAVIVDVLPAGLIPGGRTLHVGKDHLASVEQDESLSMILSADR